MSKYRKKPRVIARQWDGSAEGATPIIDWVLAGDGTATFQELSPIIEPGVAPKPALCVRTLEGTRVANPGDWIIRGVQGEFYPCKDSIFKETYEPA
jgi:hypothetical protein